RGGNIVADGDIGIDLRRRGPPSRDMVTAGVEDSAKNDFTGRHLGYAQRGKFPLKIPLCALSARNAYLIYMLYGKIKFTFPGIAGHLAMDASPCVRAALLPNTAAAKRMPFFGA